MVVVVQRVGKRTGGERTEAGAGRRAPRAVRAVVRPAGDGVLRGVRAVRRVAVGTRELYSAADRRRRVAVPDELSRVLRRTSAAVVLERCTKHTSTVQIRIHSYIQVRYAAYRCTRRRRATRCLR